MNTVALHPDNVRTITKDIKPLRPNWSLSADQLRSDFVDTEISRLMSLGYSYSESMERIANGRGSDREDSLAGMRKAIGAMRQAVRKI